MGFTGRLGTGNSRLGNILLAAVDTLGDGTFDYQVHQIKSNSVRIIFNTQIRQLDPSSVSYFTLEMVSAPGPYVVPSIISVVPYKGSDNSIILNLSQNLTTGVIYSMHMGEIFDIHGDTVSFVAKNFEANVVIPPLHRGAFLSKNGFVDILFDKNVGATSGLAQASIRDASGGPLSLMTQVTWLGSGVPANTLRFQLPAGMPTANSFIIEYSGVIDESENPGSGEVPLTLVLRTPPPYDFSALSQIQITDAYVTDTSADQLDTSTLRVYFNGPLIDAIDQSKWTFTAESVHKNHDTFNPVAFADAVTSADAIFLLQDIVLKTNSHYIQEQVHYQNYDGGFLTNIDDGLIPNDIRAQYDTGVEFSVAGQSTSPSSFSFSLDGSKFHVLNSANNTIYEYGVGTDWLVSTGSYSGNSFPIGISGTSRIRWGSNGNKLFIAINGPSRVRVYNSSVAYDLTTVLDTGLEVLLPQDTDIVGFHIKEDGKQVYFAGNTTKSIYQYKIHVPWEFATLGYSNRKFTDPEFLSISSVTLDPTGFVMHIAGQKTTLEYVVRQYRLFVPGDVSTASFDGSEYDPSVVSTTNDDILWGDDGTKLLSISNSTDKVYESSQTPFGFESALSIYQSVQSNLLKHISNAQDNYHKYPDDSSSFQPIQATSISSFVSGVNNLKARYNYHLTVPSVGFSSVYPSPIGPITDRSSYGSGKVYPTVNEYTHFVDLHLNIKSPFLRVLVQAEVTSEDSLSVTNPASITGQITSRSLHDPIFTAASQVVSNESVELFFDKEFQLPRSTSLKLLNSGKKDIFVELSAKSSLPSLDWALNNLMFAYAQHISSLNGAVHLENDIINQVNPPDYVNIASLGEIIEKANRFKNKLEFHIRSEVYHFNPDGDVPTSQPASDEASLTKLILDLRATFLRHNSRKGVHGDSGRRLVSAKFYDVLVVSTDRMKSDEAYIVSGGLNSFYYDNKRQESKYFGVSIGKVFIGSSDRPSLASAVSRPGLVRVGNDISMEVDAVELYFSKEMREEPLTPSNVSISNGSIIQKSVAWKSPDVISVEVNKMQEIIYDVTVNGLTDQSGNLVY